MERFSETKRPDSLSPSITRKIRKIFQDFNPRELSEADLEMLRQIQADKASAEDYENYRQSAIKSEGGRMAETDKSSRLMFVDFFG